MKTKKASKTNTRSRIIFFAKLNSIYCSIYCQN